MVSRTESWFMPTISSALGSLRESESALETPVDPANWTRASFTRHVSPHLPQLYRLALILSRDATEAEDLLQNSLVKAYVHRASYQGRGSLSAWLYGIVRNEHAEVMRSLKRRRSLLQAALERFGDLLDDLSSDNVAPSDPEVHAIVHEESTLLLDCLRRIPEPYRTVVHLCDVEERSYEEVSEVLDVPVGTVKSRHARGRVKLRKIFDRLRQDVGVS